MNTEIFLYQKITDYSNNEEVNTDVGTNTGITFIKWFTISSYTCKLDIITTYIRQCFIQQLVKLKIM